MTLTFFVPGKVTNPLNGSHGHWRVRAAWAKRWRTQTELRCFGARVTHMGWTLSWTPKRITFTVHVARRFDDDNLAAICKPIRDGLQGSIIHNDGPDCGHTFIYQQIVDRDNRGVEVTVEEAE